MIMVDMGCDNKYQVRVKELGLRVGTRFTLIQKAAFGGRVLFVHGTRLAVDRGFARSAQVRPCIQYAHKISPEAERQALEIAASMGDLPTEFSDSYETISPKSKLTQPTV